MPTLKIEEKVVIEAPVERVFELLLDPERVTACLPGATFDGRESDTVFKGHIKVKVGPVSTLFAGTATFAEIDRAEHRVRITGEGKDKNGAGTARMEMRGVVTPAGTGAELSVIADVDLSGKLVTFGRGLIASVSAQLFKQFAARAQAALEAAPAATPSASPPADEPPADEPPAASTGSSDAAPPAPKAAPPAAAPPPAKAQEEASINGLALLFRALGSSIARAFRRLFRRARPST